MVENGYKFTRVNDIGLCAKNVGTVMIRGLFIITIGRAYMGVHISTSMMNYETIFQFFVISNDYLDETISELIQQPKAHVKLELPTISGHSRSLKFTMNTMPVPNASHVTVLLQYQPWACNDLSFFFFYFFFLVMTNLNWVQHIQFITLWWNL